MMKKVLVTGAWNLGSRLVFDLFSLRKSEGYLSKSSAYRYFRRYIKLYGGDPERSRMGGMVRSRRA